MRRLLVAVALLAAVAAAPAQPDDESAYQFLAGRYAVVGRMPDSAASYSGDAEISYADGRLTLTKTIAAKVTIATGRIERAKPGGGRVLRLAWPGHGATCLWHTDLDNYARLTCTWYEEGGSHQRPGLEVYFPTAMWR